MPELVVSRASVQVGDEVVCDNRIGTVEEMTGLGFGNDTDDISVRIALKDGGGVLLRDFCCVSKGLGEGRVIVFGEADWYGPNKPATAVSRSKQ